MRLALLLLITSCAEILGIEDLPNDPPSDAPTTEQRICTAVGDTCDGDVLRQCDVVGELDVPADCSIGCIADGMPHCRRIQPSADGALPRDTEPDQNLVALSTPINVTTTINGSTGEIDGVRAAGTGVISGIGFEVRNNIGVFRFKSISINTNATLRVLGNNAVVMIAVEGSISLLANSLLDAQGACIENQAGPGGFLGGVAAAAGQGGGGGGAGAGTTNEASGGGGGGYGGDGGIGGLAPTNGLVSGGPTIGNAMIPALFGGSGGGGGGPAGGGSGGGGGGAIQLIARASIFISNGGASAINASGCGGRGSAASGGGGGGGGSGGTILLEAPVVILGDLAVLAANGGGGGAGGVDSGKGADGLADENHASGGSGSGGQGGDGGAETRAAGGGGDGDADYGGGGGGAVGRIRINTVSAPIFSPTSILSPQLGFAASVGTLALE